MRARGLGDPLLNVSDGAPGIIKAIETCFPRSERQRCLAHRMRNLAAKVPEDVWPEFKARATAAYQAPSRAIARELAAGVVADYGAELPSAVACFMDDFEACIAHLRMPVIHRRAIRTTNLLKLIQKSFCKGEKILTDGGQTDVPGRPIRHPDTQFLLKVLNSLAHGGSRNAKRSRCPNETTVGDKRPQMSRINIH